MSSYEQVNSGHLNDVIYGVDDEAKTPFSHLKGYEFKVFRRGEKSKYVLSILSVLFLTFLSTVFASVLCLANMGIISKLKEIFDYFGILF